MTTTEPTATSAGSATYTAVYERDANSVWLVELEEVPQVHTYGRTLAKAREHLLDAARLWFDDGRTIDLLEKHRLSPGANQSVKRAMTVRRKAEETSAAASAATWKAAHRLAQDGIGVRDSADLLGLSPQRISQLLSAEEPITT